MVTAVPRSGTGRPGVARRRAARQHTRLSLRARWRRAGGCGGRRSQSHPARRAPPARHRAHARGVDRDRAAPRAAARADRGTSTRRGRQPARLHPLRRRRRPRTEPGQTARRRPRGRPRRGSRPGAGPRHAVGAHLHVRHVGRTQGRHLQPAAVHGHRQPDGHDHGPRPRRRRLRVHAALPLERADGRLVAVDRVRRVGGIEPQVQRLAVAGRRPPLRLDVFQLHRKAAGVPPRDAGAPRRRRQPAAGRVRQRGLAGGRRSVLASLRRGRHRCVRSDRGRCRRRP